MDFNVSSRIILACPNRIAPYLAEEIRALGDVEKNILKMLEFKNQNIQSVICCVINPLNAFYFDKLEDWSKKHNIIISTSSCHGIFGMESMNPLLKSFLLQKYHSDHSITKILHSAIENTKISKKLLENLEKNDLNRDISWKETFPDIVPYIKRYI